MILLLLFGLFVKCVSVPISNGTSHQSSDIAEFRREVMLLKPTETNRAYHKPCHKVLCADGRCVSHSWHCHRDTDVGLDDSPLASHDDNTDDMRKQQSLFSYGIGTFGVILIVIVILVCMCAIEDKEYAEHNFNYHKRTTNKDIYPYSRLENSFNYPCEMYAPSKSSEISQKVETVPDVKIIDMDEKC